MKNKTIKSANFIKMLSIIIVLIATVLLFLFVAVGFDNKAILVKIRLNKIISLFLVGATAGIGSYITQILTRNKKADMATIGVSATNILMILLVVSLGSGVLLTLWRDNYLIPLIFASSILSVFFIWFLTTYVFKKSNNILIMGIVFTLFVSAIVYILIEKEKVHDQEAISSFLVGTILVSNMNVLLNVQQVIAIIGLMMTAIWLFMFGNKLVISVSDDKKAISLGINPKLHKIMAICFIAICASCCFLLCGNIMFIGFAIGNLNYILFRKNTKISSFSTILIGGTLACLSFYFFNYLFGFRTYAGVYIIIMSGIILLITTIFERMTLWKKK